MSPHRARGCLTGLRTGRGAAGRLSPPPRQATGVSPHPGRCPWLPPRPQLLLPGLGYHGRPRRLTGLRGAARRLRRLPPGRGFVPGGLPGLRCGGPGPGGADSLQAPPLPRLLLRAAAPLQAPAPPRPPLRLPRLPQPRPPPPPRVKEAPGRGSRGCPPALPGRGEELPARPPGPAEAVPRTGLDSPRRWLWGLAPRPLPAAAFRRCKLGAAAAGTPLRQPVTAPARGLTNGHPGPGSAHPPCSHPPCSGDAVLQP